MYHMPFARRRLSHHTAVHYTALLTCGVSRAKGRTVPHDLSACPYMYPKLRARAVACAVGTDIPTALLPIVSHIFFGPGPFMPGCRPIIHIYAMCYVYVYV